MKKSVFLLFGKFALLVGGGCPCRESGYGGGAQSEDGTCCAYHSDFSRKDRRQGSGCGLSVARLWRK